MDQGASGRHAGAGNQNDVFGEVQIRDNHGRKTGRAASRSTAMKSFMARRGTT
jgi:hypothetical protein